MKGDIIMAQTYGNGITAEEKGNIITLSFDKTKDFGMTKQQKNLQVASTLGNIRVGNINVTCTAYKKAA